MEHEPALQPDRIFSVPRPVTRRVGWRCWAEPYVRFWWLCAAALALIAGGLAAASLAKWNHDRWLIRDGIAIQAIVQQAGEQTLPGRKQPPDTICILRFDWNGQEHVTRPKALEGRTEFIAPRDTVRITVNPDDPDDWTASTRPGPLSARLIGAGIALAISFLALVVSLWLRIRVLRVWRQGQAIEALVVEAQHSALAPLAAVIRCTPSEESDRRLFTVYVPQRTGTLQRGDSLVLLTGSPRSTAAHAAAWFE